MLKLPAYNQPDTFFNLILFYSKVETNALTLWLQN